MKKKVIVLILSIIIVTGFTFLAWLLPMIPNLWARRVAGILINLLNGGVAVVAMKLTGIKVDLDLKNKKQYLIGICIALVLSLSIAVIPTFFGGNIVGPHAKFTWISIIYSLLFYILIIGPVEELIFRVYMQDTLVSFFKKNKWIGVIITALIFGFWHLINGSFIQVLFTFGIGLIFGFSKYLIKDCKYLGLALGHGLYDFFNVIVRMFMV